MAKDKKFKPKYYAKVPLGKNRNRYFYSREEYLAYLKDKKNVEDSAKTPSEKEPVSTGKKIADKVFSSTRKTDLSNLTEKGKQLVTETIEKVGNKTVNSVKASDVVVEVAEKVVSWARGGLVKVVYDEVKEKTTEAKYRKERDEKTKRNEGDSVQREKELAEQGEAIDELKKDRDKIPGLDLKEGPCTDAQDMDAVNPYYAEGENYAYSNNCAYCTAAYELRQRGYDVEAAAVTYSTANTIDEVCSWYEGEEVRTTEDLLAENNVNQATIADVAEWIEEDLVQHGDGARGQFLLYWAAGGGHSVAWEVVGNEVILRDCQTNDVVNVVDYLQYASGAAYFRTDNIELSDKIKDTVVNTDESRRVRDRLR